MAVKMNQQSAAPVFRVHAAGLTHVEKAVLRGLLHLAEAQGVRFRMEEQADSAHLFVLDANHPGGAELRRSIAQFEQRVIWVDRAAGEKAAREIQRPLRWPALLDMMVQAAREFGKPARPRQRPVAMIGFGRLCELCRMILRGHFGTAAEPMVQRARAEMEAYAAANRSVGTHVFLGMLMKQLPETANPEKIRREIDAWIARNNLRAQTAPPESINASIHAARGN
jgi:hypothetical protein